MEDKDPRGDCQEEQTEGKIEVLKDGRKIPKRSNVNVNIRYVDKHFLASFNHEHSRIFHNMDEVLMATQVEAEKLRDG